VAFACGWPDACPVTIPLKGRTVVSFVLYWCLLFNIMNHEGEKDANEDEGEDMKNLQTREKNAEEAGKVQVEIENDAEEGPQSSVMNWGEENLHRGRSFASQGLIQSVEVDCSINS
jgi:hypothetical protein